MSNPLIKLKKIIQKAVPNIQSRNTSVMIPEPFGGIINYRDDTIRLADVLIVIKKHFRNKGKDYNYWNKGVIVLLGNGGLWNLKKDNLDDQDKSTLNFLYDLFEIK